MSSNTWQWLIAPTPISAVFPEMRCSPLHLVPHSCHGRNDLFSEDSKRLWFLWLTIGNLFRDFRKGSDTTCRLVAARRWLRPLMAPCFSASFQICARFVKGCLSGKLSLVWQQQAVNRELSVNYYQCFFFWFHNGLVSIFRCFVLAPLSYIAGYFTLSHWRESGPVWTQSFMLRRYRENKRRLLPAEAPPLSVASHIVRAVKRSAGNPRQM